MYIVKGYEVPKGEELFSVIERIRDIVSKRAYAEYCKLLAEEIEQYVDNCILGICKPNTEQVILDTAITLLNQNISHAIANGYTSKYNLAAKAYVYSHDGVTYVEVNRSRDIYDKAIDKLNCLKNKSVIEHNSFAPSSTSANKELWTAIFEEAKSNIVLTVPLYPNGKMDKPDVNKLTFRQPKERASVLARQHLCSILLSQFPPSSEALPPMIIMQRMELVLQRLKEQAVLDEIEMRAKELATLLPEITSEIVTSPAGSVQQQDQSR